MSTFTLRIATPSGDYYLGEAEYFSVEASDGRVGFMRGASARVLAVKAGRAEITANNKKIVCYCDDGILHVAEHGVTLITSDCRAENIVEQTDRAFYADRSREYKYTKAKLASSILRSKEKKGEDTY